MRKRYTTSTSDNSGGVNPEPSAIGIAKMAAYRARGESPGNPKWYKPLRVKPYEFVPGLPAKLPFAGLFTVVRPIPPGIPYGHDEDPAGYVAEFEVKNSLKHHPTEWIRPSLGSFG